MAQEHQEAMATTADAGGGGLLALIETEIFRAFGLWGLVALGLIALLLLAWWLWTRSQARRRSATPVEPTLRKALPVATGGGFAVAVADLDGDRGGTLKRRLVEALTADGGVQLLDVGPSASRATEEVLAATGAQALVRGTIASEDGRAASTLTWTGTETAHDGGRWRPAEALDLAARSHGQLIDGLRLLALVRSAEGEGGDGAVTAGRLADAIALVRRQLEAAGADPEPAGASTAATWRILGDAFRFQGELSGRNAPLVEAAAAYETALEAVDRIREPLYWARIQSELGKTFARLGAREGEAARFRQAASAFRAALDSWSDDEAPLERAMTQASLADALLRLGERETASDRLGEAVETYGAALRVLSPERLPLAWARAHNNLGLALWRLGAREGDLDRLEAADRAFRAALEVYEHEPLATAERAMARNNLGAVLASLGEHDEGNERASEAVALLRSALDLLDRGRDPLNWAMTQHSLGQALQILGERTGGIACLEEAVAAHRSALAELSRDRTPLRWAAAQGSLSLALSALGERQRDARRLSEAVEAIADAIDVFGESGLDPYRADLSRKLGIVKERILAIRDGGREAVHDATAPSRARPERHHPERS